MMKFIVPLLFFSLLTNFSVVYYWLLISFLIIMLIYFLVMNLYFTDSEFIGSTFFLDLSSFSLISLSFLIIVLMYLSSNKVFDSKSSLYLFVFMIYILLLILVVCFSVNNVLTFYFFFEASLIPTMVIILGWGYQPERLQAGLYFLFYTLTASLPLLICLFYIKKKLGSLDIFMWLGVANTFSMLLIFLGLTLAFMVKMPMFFVHLWLPKAHVEAPVAGSMILAGVLLKLGGYGLYRVLFFCRDDILQYSSYYFGLSVLGMFYVGLMCCRLNDFKALVAYSSVAHMGMVICGIFSYYYWGLTGSLMMMISHGLASSGLFCAVNIYYEKLGSRSFYLNKGLILLLPMFTLMFFMLSIANMAAPPTINLMSEIFLMASMLKYDYLMLLIFPLGSYLGAVFTLFMFSYSQHGKIYSSIYSYMNVNFREMHILMYHILPVNMLIVNYDYFTNLY